MKEIAITPAEIVHVETTWHVNIIDSGGADVELAFAVARKVQDNLSSLFEVID